MFADTAAHASVERIKINLLFMTATFTITTAPHFSHPIHVLAIHNLVMFINQILRYLTCDVTH